MSDISSVGTLGQASIADPSASTSTALESLDKDVFLELMVAQMRYQNPLDPVDSNQYLNQLAQYASVEQLENVAQGQADLRSMQMISVATGMVGRDVTAIDTLSGELVRGQVSTVRFGPEPILVVDGFEIPMSSVVSVEQGDQEAQGSDPSDPDPATPASPAEPDAPTGPAGPGIEPDGPDPNDENPTVPETGDEDLAVDDPPAIDRAGVRPAGDASVAGQLGPLLVDGGEAMLAPDPVRRREVAAATRVPDTDVDQASDTSAPAGHPATTDRAATDGGRHAPPPPLEAVAAADRGRTGPSDAARAAADVDRLRRLVEEEWRRI